MSIDSLFFPRLKRREQYRIKGDSEYYIYGEYKLEIREDCLGRCIYCDIHENENGGPESMNLDHFRPQKYEEHKHLVNDPNNLVWSCSGCNRLKADRWPALGTSSTMSGNEGFVEPFAEDRLIYFEVLPDGQLLPLRSPAKYMITLLALNRSSRKRIRELRYLKQTWLLQFEHEIAKMQCLLENSNLTDDQRIALNDHIKWLRSKQIEIQRVLLDFDLH
jgi:5-methylcytosine-specific restriction endonuclease McrA